MAQTSGSHPETYLLPSSLSIQVDDRFSILDRDEPLVPFWDLLEALLDQEISSSKALIDLLESISVTLHGSSRTDYGSLRRFLDNSLADTFWISTWPVLKDIALRMPKLFPDNVLPILSRSCQKITLSREQVACLVIHQFLCTLPVRSWEEDLGFQDFHVWYRDYQPHAGAVDAYFKALFAYFERLAGESVANPISYTQEDWPITYELTSDSSDLLASTGNLNELKVLRLNQASTDPAVLGLPNGAAVISANKFIGFGCTGTQEETHVGGSPEACPAVLVTPPLEYDQVMIITGAEAMVSILGYGRQAHCGEVLRAANHLEQKAKWSNRTMLFMDAMELDLADQSLGMPVDLQPGNVERDLRKAFMAFRHKRRSSSSGHPPTIFTGYWGCRTFGGNPEIKTCIQWCAASLAGCDLTFICSGIEQEAFAWNFEGFREDLKEMDATSEQLRDLLLVLKPQDILSNQNPLVVIAERLHRSSKGA